MKGIPLDVQFATYSGRLLFLMAKRILLLLLWLRFHFDLSTPKLFRLSSQRTLEHGFQNEFLFKVQRVPK